MRNTEPAWLAINCGTTLRERVATIYAQGTAPVSQHLRTVTADVRNGVITRIATARLQLMEQSFHSQSARRSNLPIARLPWLQPALVGMP
jgi:hypothetical protein